MAKKYANKFKDGDGVWRTIGGRRVFIRTGQDLPTAMKESGKFKNLREAYHKDINSYHYGHNKEYYKKIVDNWEDKANKATDVSDYELAKSQKSAWEKEYLEAKNKEKNFKNLYNHPKEADTTYDLVGQHINKKQQLEDIDRKWKEQATKMEKDYEEYGTTYWQDEKRLNELSTERDRLSIYRESPMEEEARLKKQEEESWIKEEKADKRISRTYNKKLAEDDRISKGMTKEEYKKGKYSFEKDKEIENAIKSVYIYQDEPTMGTLKDEPLKPYYDAYGKDNVDRVWKEMDKKYVIARGTSVDTEGLHYNNLINRSDYSPEALENYTNKLNQLRNSDIGYYDSRKYNQKANELFEELKNSKNAYEDVSPMSEWSDTTGTGFSDLQSTTLKTRYKGTYDYLKESTNLSEKQILEILKRMEKDK